MKKKNQAAHRGSHCQQCGAFRRVGLNGRLPPHKCAPPRPVFPKSAARRVYDISDDGLSSAIRGICYGSAT